MKSTPPLIMLAEGRRPRPRKPVVPAPREAALHNAVADLLRRCCRSNWRWSHFPSGEKRDPITGARLKRMGLMRGWPDIVPVDPDGKFYGLELKRSGEDLTPEQEAFRDWCTAHDIPHAVCYSIDRAFEILGNWGALTIRPVGGRDHAAIP
jgi:hypothetical protein